MYEGQLVMKSIWSDIRLDVPLLVGAAVLVACTNGRTVHVSVRGLTDQVKAIKVAPSIDEDGPRWQAQRLERRETRFDLRFPQGTTGALSLRLGGLDQDGCQVSAGTGTVDLASEAAPELAIDLLPEPGCRLQLSIEREKDTNGSVTWDPPGLSCGADCASFPLGTEVTLTPTLFATTTTFATFSGVCGHKPSCQVVIQDEPQTLALRFRSRQACHSDGWCWISPSSQGATLSRLWGTSRRDLWAVGRYGAVLHSDGVSWEPLPSGTVADLSSIWGRSWDDVWVVGAGGIILHWDGDAFTRVPSGTVQDLTAVWAAPPQGGSSAPQDLWIAGARGTLLHGVGRSAAAITFTATESGTAESLRALWGTAANDAWAVGDAGVILRLRDEGWRPIAMTVASDLKALWGSRSQDVWAVGKRRLTAPTLRGEGVAEPRTARASVALHWDGTSWRSTSVRAATGLVGLWGRARDDVYASDEVGGLQRWDGASWSPLSTGQSRPILALWTDDQYELSVGQGGLILSTEYRWGSLGWRRSLISRGIVPGDLWASAAYIKWSDFGDFPFRYVAEVIAVGDDGAIVSSSPYWHVVDSGVKSHLYSATNGSPFVIVGAQGTILLGPGSGPFQRIDSGTTETLRSISYPWVVGSMGTILRMEGTSVTKVDSGTTETLLAVAASSSGEAWAVGTAGTVLRYDGTRWQLVPSGTKLDLRGVYARGPDDVWIVGQDNLILRWISGSFTREGQELSASGATLVKVGEIGRGNVFVSGTSGLSIWDGTGWGPWKLVTGTTLTDVNVDAGLVVGSNGALIDGSATALARFFGPNR